MKVRFQSGAREGRILRFDVKFAHFRKSNSARRSSASRRYPGGLRSSSFQSREVECFMVKSARIAFAASLVGILTAATAGPASALAPQANASLQQQLRLQDQLITEIRARAGGSVRRTTVVGPRGNAASRTVVRRGAVVAPGVARPGAWVRPAHYAWRPGGAIAAGAAIGFRRSRHGGGMGGFAAGAGLLLVLHRSEPDAGLLGCLPVIAHVRS